MTAIDLNADMGEYADKAQQDREAALMPLISSCSIACGGHAGDEKTMRVTACLAKRYGVHVGAHPSYPDREGFGRRRITITHAELRTSLKAQIASLQDVLQTEDLPLSHVKPHGALYNDAAQDPTLAALVIEASSGCTVVGQPQSAIHKEAEKAGVPFVSEGFVDRLYQASGALTPRSQPGAVIKDILARAKQAVAIACGETFDAIDGPLSLRAETLCIHSDSPGAVETANAVRNALESSGFTIRAFT
ncbi:MAG: 5-oxoprolinase subunit PxpA [Pseudomonadota bacterium]